MSPIPSWVPDVSQAFQLESHFVDRFATIAALEQVVVQGSVERSEEHTSELQSLMRISYAVFFLKTKISVYAVRTDLHVHEVRKKENIVRADILTQRTNAIRLYH